MLAPSIGSLLLDGLPSLNSSHRLQSHLRSLNGAAAKHNNLASYWTFLGAADGVVCFYCGFAFRRTRPGGQFIPWAFVLEDKVWNLVLACASCNGKKTSSVASKTYIEGLNDQNGKPIVKSSETLPQFISRELAEWRARSLRDPLVLLAERCLLDFFPAWCR